jgi:DNA-binding MarR family transcriptional regulator
VTSNNKTRTSRLSLQDFVPFRLNRLATAVSEHLSEIYRDRFALDIPEWRVLVTLGERQACTAQQIGASTRMHKTRVSRAVASLLKRQLIERVANSSDARELSLHLSKAGKRLYTSLVPLALERERLLLSCLDSVQQRSLMEVLSCLEKSLGLSDK